MACPYFDPGERRPGSNGSLGDLYVGLCRASGLRPDDQTLHDSCNLGYARGRCANFPDGGGPDAVRFCVSTHEGSGIRILYSLECDHRPHSHGALDYSTQAGAFVGSLPDGQVERLATAFVRSYLRRIAR